MSFGAKHKLVFVTGNAGKLKEVNYKAVLCSLMLVLLYFPLCLPTYLSGKVLD